MIDFVITYTDLDPIKKTNRTTFEENLVHEGLQLEEEDRKVNAASVDGTKKKLLFC